MYVKSIEHILRSPVVIINYQDETKRPIAINLRNVLEMSIEATRSSTSPPCALIVSVTRKKDRIEQTGIDNPVATLWIYCESTDEAEDIRKELFDLHRKTCGCSWSTSIHGYPTVGRGELSDSGYWEYGCYLCARESEKSHPEQGKVWPFEQEG